MALPSFRPPAEIPYGPIPPPGPPRVLGLPGRYWALVACALAVGYVAMAAIAVTGVVRVVNRKPTAAELRQAADAEVARRWRAWPSGRIFPERLGYVPRRAAQEFATRAGIAPDIGCAGSVDASVAPILQRHGCRAVVRATYTDQLEGIAVTIGVVAFPDQQAAFRARQELKASATALRAAPFPGTAAARFGDPARQAGTSERAGPYLLLTTAGQTDGRPAAAIRDRRDEEIFEIAPQLAHTVGRTLAQRALPDCSRAEWEC